MNWLPIHYSKLLITFSISLLGYILSLWSFFSFHQNFHSLSSQNSHFLFCPFLFSLIGLWWLGWVSIGLPVVLVVVGNWSGCRMLWMWWIVDRPMVVGHAMGLCGCGGPFIGLWWLDRWVMPWAWWVCLWRLEWVSIRLFVGCFDWMDMHIFMT